MECVACGLGAGFNRAVVDTAHGTELGGFCSRCEDREFGRSLTRGDWRTVEGCAFCDRDGFYAFPEWKPYCERQGGDVVCKVDYRVDEATLRLCDEHFTTLTGRPVADHAVRSRRDETELP